MSNTIGYDLEGFANSAVTKTVTTSVSSDIALYLPFDSDLNDDSTNSHTVTNSGSVAVSTSVKKYGAGSADIPAAADYLEISGGQFDFGSNDFTIEGWFYDDGSGGSRNVALDYRLSGGGAAGSGSETFGFFFYLNSAGNGQFFIGLADDAANLGVWPMFSSSSLAISTNTWTHYAFTREGSTFRAFKGGSLIATQTGVTSAVGSSGGSAILRIGSGHDGSGSYGMAGYIDDLRIINGAALYTAAFTPPTSAVGLTGDVTNTIVDQKFLSSVWDSDDVSEKMADGTWIRNDSTSGANPAGVVVQGAGLEVSGHRWYTAPPAPPPELSFDVLVTAGGAGGGFRDAGGGGGGGVIAWTPITSSRFTAFPVTIGSGGGGSTGTGTKGTSGGNSVFGSPSVPTILTAIGGGGGASSAPTVHDGLPGGSGGGGSRGGSGGGNTTGQGQPGGAGTPGGGNVMGGGGGGYTSAGNTSGPGYGGTGYSVPAGLQANPTFGPSHTVISSGGGGGKESGAGAPGGTGAGNGGDPTPAPERDASSYGSGGGGGGNNNPGGAGKDGVVVIRHTSPVGPSAATGGTISSHPDGYIYHVFTSPGTFTIA